MPRHLIINADDFGLSRSVNEGVRLAVENGPLTSASLMVTADAVDDAVAIARDYSQYATCSRPASGLLVILPERSAGAAAG